MLIMQRLDTNNAFNIVQRLDTAQMLLMLYRDWILLRCLLWKGEFIDSSDSIQLHRKEEQASRLRLLKEEKLMHI